MAVSKHNLWKRKKNGVMKLVRSHSDWLQERRDRKMRELGSKRTVEESGQWWEKKNNTPSVTPNKSVASSAKRTQVGKKI